MIKKQFYILSIAAMCLLLGQAAAISENQTSLENESLTLENNGLISYENNELISYENNESLLYEYDESIPSGNDSSGLFSLAPLNPDFEEYLENKGQNKDLLLLNSAEVSDEDTENLITGFIPAPVDLSHMKTVENLTGDSYPVSYDLRTLGFVSPVRDQMDAGSCWAHGACAALESYLLKTEGKNWDFSENNIKNLLSEDYPEGFDRTYDDGGDYFMTTAYFARWSGPVSETDDSYDPHSGVSPTDLPSLKHIHEALFLPARSGPEDNDLIKWALMNYGAVDSVVYMSNDLFDTANFTYYYKGSNCPNHLIAIVGWDDSFDRNKFTPAAPGDGAFIVKNSWGTGWGEEGFFYVSYYDTVIGSENTVRPAEDLNSYSHMYQYDPLGWIESIGASGSSTAWAANVFTAEENETLEAVSFYTTATSTSYEIYIYTDPVSGPVNPEGAESSASGTITFAGYHTIPLNSSVPLESGQNFSVVVKFTTPGYSFPVAVELQQEEYSSKARANSGESFFSPDGENWVDTALAIENTNVCIKAFTNRSEAPEAAFTSNVTSGPAPLTVEFIDASTLSPTTWYWDFGDGNTSTDRFPTHNYMEPGKYNVTLRAENEYGNSTLEKTEWISVTGSSLLYVDDDGAANFTSIQEAIDAASPGATIIVRNGTYTENVDVDRAVTILSESGPEYTEVKAAKSNDSVFYVTADAVNISGFSVSGGSELVSSSSYATAGIWLYGVKDCNISGNILSDNYIGLYVIATDNCTLENNSAESNYDGFYLNRAEGTILRNNRMENNSYNFAFKGASTEQDIDESNTIEGKPIYYLVNESNLVLDSGSNAGTVYCIGCQNVTVRDLNLSRNYYGLYLYNTMDSRIENISSSDNGYGIYIRNVSGLNLTDSSAGSNFYGLYIQDSEWESISGNCMDGNLYNFMITGDCTAQTVPEIESGNLLDGKKLYILSGVSNLVLDAESNAGSVCLLNCQNISVRDLVLQDEMSGIYLYKTEEGLIENNTLSGNCYGVYLEDSENSTVEDNKISDNSYGIYLTSSSGNSLANNTMSGNSGYGIYLSESGSNTIGGNNASGNNIGIHAAYSDNNTFVENVALDNTLGFYLLDSDYNVLTANTANSNSESGFDLTISQHNTLSGNTVSGNTRGITLQGWAGERSTADNILFSNTISNNSELGIWLTVAENNTLYGNSFNNTKNVKDTGHNTWNTTIGNFWSDYTGSDSDGNGIGDTPYVINSITGSKDYLPICREAGVPLTLYVGSGPGAISSIQAALDAAWDGDTILVSPGTYTENLQVNKSVSIIASGSPSNTIIRTASPEKNILSVRADSVTFSGFTLAGVTDGYAAGIYLDSASDCNLSGNVLSENYYGVLLTESENCTLSENTITGGRFGINLVSSGNNTLFNNSVSLVSICGIWLQEASFNEISQNELQNNSFGLAILYVSDGNELYNNTISEGIYGLLLDYSKDNILRNNSMQNNTYNLIDYVYFRNENLIQNDIDTSNLVNGKPVYYLVGESDLVLDSASNAGTVYLLDCENVTVRDLDLENNGFGVFAIETSNSTLQNLTVSENRYGILDMYGNRNNCSYNTAENNTYGIYVVCGENDTLNNNSILENYYCGIDISGGNHNSLNNNSISEGEYGLMLASDSTVLRNNLVSDNYCNFGVYSHGESVLRSCDIDTSNLVDGKPVYYLKGESGRVLDSSSNAGTVYLVDCNNITVRGLVLKNNYMGISLCNTTDSNLEGNNLINNDYGFFLDTVYNSSLAGNNVSNNNYGLYLKAACNNSIYDNLFRNTYENIYLNGVNTGNTWNVSRTEGANIMGGSCIGGNFWANPSGTGFSETTPDEDGDGFCDSPYGIPGSENESDSLPLHSLSNVSEDEEDDEESGSSGNSGRSHSAIYGGISGISSADILTSSVSRQQVIAGQKAEFSFNEPGCGVTGISFVSGINAGTVTGKVQTLNGLPDTISEAPAGELYQYMSIVIGSQFFGESGAFEGATIDFKVPRSWVEENNIDEASLVLNRYHDNAWVQLSTEKTGEDDEFLYFRAETPGFSYYSITGEKKRITITPESNGSEADTQQITGNDVQDTSTKKSPGFELGFTVAGILSVLCLLKKR